MSGGAAVLEALGAIARLRLPRPRRAVIGGTGTLLQRATLSSPVTSSLGPQRATIEVNNPDAEGAPRWLSTALRGGASRRPSGCVTLAHLTGGDHRRRSGLDPRRGCSPTTTEWSGALEQAGGTMSASSYGGWGRGIRNTPRCIKGRLRRHRLRDDAARELDHRGRVPHRFVGACHGLIVASRARLGTSATLNARKGGSDYRRAAGLRRLAPARRGRADAARRVSPHTRPLTMPLRGLVTSGRAGARSIQ